jgi:putative ABC transport system substrate-binding protein
MLRDAFAALGYVDGKNLRLDFRLTEGDTKRLPELAEALVREKVSVIYAAGPAAARAAQGATRTIPIVATGSDLPNTASAPLPETGTPGPTFGPAEDMTIPAYLEPSSPTFMPSPRVG